MKILVVHQFYLAPNQPGGSRFNEFARMWAEAGHSVTVIAGTRNYSTGAPTGTGTDGVVSVEWDDKVRVLRCWVPEAYQSGYVGRAFGFLGFAAATVLGVLKAERPDIVIATSPPLTIAWTGWLASKLRFQRVPWVFEVRDLWPESAVTTGVLKPGSLVTRLLYRLEAFACRSADAISVLTPAFEEDLIRRSLALPEKIVFIPNAPDTDQFKPQPKSEALRRELGWGKRFVVMYAGAHGRANALLQVIEAAELLKKRSDILLACIGDGADRLSLAAEADRRGLNNVIFHGPFAKQRMPDLVNACDAGLAVLQRNPTFKTVYPNKVFDYMACGKPVILGIDGVARKLVCEEARAGLFAEPESPQDLAEAVESLADAPKLCDELGNNGLTWVSSGFSRRSTAMRYLEVMAELCHGTFGGVPCPDRNQSTV